MNFTVSSSGRQFDRLALMFFNDTEVWRTSTAEPKPTPGIVWTYWKDMTEFLALWKSPQTIIFELGNLVDEMYTGSFNCTLTATFFKSQVIRQHQGGTPADMIIPISAKNAPASLSDKIDAYWVVTGKIFVWLDEPGSVTTGAAPKVDAPEPLLSISHQRRQDGHGVNEFLDYSLRVRRAVSVSGEVCTQKGAYQAWWHQELRYSNLGHVSSFGTNQINRMTISGADEASGPRQYATEYSYPLYANTSFSIGSDKSLTIEAELEQGLRLKTWGHAIFASGLEVFGAVSQDGNQLLGCKLETLRTGRAGFHQSGDRRRSSGSGWTRQDFYFGGIDSGSKDDVALYVRNVTAINDTVVSDREVSSRQGDSSGERTILRDYGKPTTPSNSRQNAGQFAPPKGKHTLWGSWGESGHVVGLDEW
ncbi:hypothetical protein ACHAP9_002429 [Verticillium nonalfalfae]